MKLGDKIEWKVLDCCGHKAYMLTNQLMVSDNSLVLIIIDGGQYQFTSHCFCYNIDDFLQACMRKTADLIAIVVSKVDQMVKMSRDEMSRKWNEHLYTCLHQFLEIRRDQIKQMEAAIAAYSCENE